jgi:hypothetical protein
MEMFNSWIFWGALILILIFIFPKSCGTIIPSENIYYKCAGIKTTFSVFHKLNNSMQFCSGLCFSKSKQKSIVNANDSNSNSGAPSTLSGMINPLRKSLLPLIAIIILIAVIGWITSMRKKLEQV